MNNNKWIKVLLLMTAAFFITSAAYAKNRKYESKNYLSYWHLNPFYQVKKAVKKVNALQRQISKLQRKANRLERKKNMLEEQLADMESEIGILKERKQNLTKEDTVIQEESNDDKISIAYCPKCNFIGVDDLDGYDLSWAYLRGSNFMNSTLNKTDFSQANMKKCMFNGAQLDGVVFSGADLSEASFVGATLTNVIWGDSENGYATCPDGTNAQNVGGTCEGNL